MSLQLDVALKAHCASLGSQSLASFMQPTRAKLQQNGAVIQYAEQEKTAGNERLAMGQHDPITLKAQEACMQFSPH